MFLEIPATDINDVDISTALQFPKEQIDQETCPEEFQVRFCGVINACKVVTVAHKCHSKIGIFLSF